MIFKCDVFPFNADFVKTSVVGDTVCFEGSSGECSRSWVSLSPSVARKFAKEILRRCDEIEGKENV